jgi:polyhydroxyalkanoate synthesis regulator protein
MRTLRLYPANRRLYCRELSRYVTLEEIARFVVEGQPVSAVHRNGRVEPDLTLRVLAGALLRQVTEHRCGALTAADLRELIAKAAAPKP